MLETRRTLRQLVAASFALLANWYWLATRFDGDAISSNGALDWLAARNNGPIAPPAEECPAQQNGGDNQTDQTAQPPLPDVLLLGVQKAGSTAISEWLIENGACHARTFDGEPQHYEKEVHFFNEGGRFGRGIEFYSRRFEHCRAERSTGGVGGGGLMLDATPNYFEFASRVHGLYARPEAAAAMCRLKLMVVLREPVSREFSLYRHKVDHYAVLKDRNAWFGDVAFPNGTVMSFDVYAASVLVSQILQNNPGHTGRRYVEHLKEWVAYFGREKILILSYDELKRNSTAFQRRVGEFLGVALPVAMRMRSGNAGEGPSERARRVLEPLFEGRNRELYDFLDSRRGLEMEMHPFPRFDS